VRILVLGSGGREDAIAWALEWEHHANDDEVFVAPGNGGSRLRLDVDPTDPQAVVDLCRREAIDLVVIGPESSLAAGVSDALRKASIPVFGPSAQAAMLETSKAFCRSFATKHSIPSPVSEVFAGPQAAEQALLWADQQSFEIVVKADGLAAGKGVVVPSSVDERNAAITTLSLSGDLVLEERLFGEEVSLLVFTDGTTICPMPPARDHKCIGEGDTGANTGGMGVYAPTASCPSDMVDRIVREIIQPAIDGLRAMGTAYVGVLYAGIMLTARGPKLIEFNCRFGDPEAQALLPLLQSELKSVLLACVNETLSELDIRWSSKTSCAVVAAAPGYPSHPILGGVVSGLESVAKSDNVQMFHAGTEKTGNEIRVNGGRVMCVTGLGEDLSSARQSAYAAIKHMNFEGQQIRRDIGWRELARTTGGYANSGVNIDEGNRAVDLMKKKVEATHTSNVLGGLGSFGGALAVRSLMTMNDPVLVASTDGVGTKVMLATDLGRFDTIGHDIVNHCVNDVLVQRATPLFFLDYVASSSISAEMVASIVGGMADACAANSCVLLGGETAEMPGVYSPGHFDVAGTLVGVVDRSRLLPSKTIEPGDLMVGLLASGLHTNGYSLARRIFAGLPLDVVPQGWTCTLGDALLASHRSYLNVLDLALKGDVIKGLAHITGGGFEENIPRVLPPGCSAKVDLGSWPMIPIFELIRDVSGLSDRELYRTFNMGIGMVIIIKPSDLEELRSQIDEPIWVMGEVTSGNREVDLA